MFKFNTGRSKRVIQAAFGTSGGGGGNASFMSGGGQGGGNSFGGASPGGLTVQRFNPIYDDLSEGSIIEQFMPVDPRRLHRIWRRIFLQDPVAGPAIEVIRDLPWSDFAIMGIHDPTIRRFYEDAYNAIGAVSLMPEITGEFLTMGKYIAHFIFDDMKGYFTNCIIHDPDFVKVIPSPISGFAPKINLIPTPEMRGWAMSNDERDLSSQQMLGAFLSDLKGGKEIPLPLENTIYVPRKTAPYDSIGASIFTRLLLFVAYEKALVNSTIATAKRRAGQIRHVKVGIDGVWEPDDNTMADVAQSFIQADQDPVGAIVVTRTGVDVTPVGGNTPQDMIKISDEWKFLTEGKMAALGISDTFINGDATYNNLEQLMSIFLEKMRALRAFHTTYFLDEIARRLARANNFVHRTEAELRHGIRIARSEDDERLILPSFGFSKSLRPVADKDYMDILTKLEEKGVPITIRTWAASGGFPIDDEIQQYPEDVKLRKQLAAHKRQIAGLDSTAPSTETDSGGFGLGTGGLGELPPEPEPTATETPAVTPTAPGGPTVKASVGHYSMIDKVVNLPIWKTGVFLGLRLEDAKQSVEKLGNMLGYEEAKAFAASDLKQAITTGNKNRDFILTYVLNRAGLLKNCKVPNYIAEDIAKELANIKVAGLMGELSALMSMTYMTSNPDSEPSRPGLPFKLPVLPGGNEKLLHTGFTNDPSILRA